MHRYTVSEIFGPTIQGEGMNAGRSCLFLRFSKCNLWPSPDKPSATCPWCNTPQLHRGEPMTQVDICRELGHLSSGQPQMGLVITGGEPLLQLDEELLAPLATMFPWIDVETNGTIKPKFKVPRARVKLSVSPKTPKVLVQPDWWKFLIPAKEDLLALTSWYDDRPIFLQPVEPLNEDGGSLDSLTYRKNVERCVELAHKTGARVCLQLHKLLYLP